MHVNYLVTILLSGFGLFLLVLAWVRLNRRIAQLKQQLVFEQQRARHYARAWVSGQADDLSGEMRNAAGDLPSRDAAERARNAGLRLQATKVRSLDDYRPVTKRQDDDAIAMGFSPLSPLSPLHPIHQAHHDGAASRDHGGAASHDHGSSYSSSSDSGSSSGGDSGGGGGGD